MSIYTVKQLARLSGVSVRTLHHYDEIGLLKPAFVDENRYRYYAREELLRPEDPANNPLLVRHHVWIARCGTGLARPKPMPDWPISISRTPTSARSSTRAGKDSSTG